MTVYNKLRNVEILFLLNYYVYMKTWRRVNEHTLLLSRHYILHTLEVKRLVVGLIRNLVTNSCQILSSSRWSRGQIYPNTANTTREK